MAALDARSLLTHETTSPRMPRSTGAGDIVRMVGGWRSEWWARSDQNAGRLQIGIGGRLTSEFAIDRLTDQTHIITTGTDSYRFRRPRRNGRRGNHEREDSKAPLSWAEAQLSRSNTGGWANIRQHKWADIHCHS
jgi:hypothetical protein